MNRLEDLQDDAHLKATGFFKTIDDPAMGTLRFPGVPVQIDGHGCRCAWPPRLGEHTARRSLREAGIGTASHAPTAAASARSTDYDQHPTATSRCSARASIWQDLEVGQRFRTHRRTVTEADLVNFIGVTGMLESDLHRRDAAAGAHLRAARCRPLLTTALIEGFIFQTMIQGTGLAMLESTQQGARAGARRRHHPRDRRSRRRQAHLEGQPRHRRLDDQRLQPERRSRC